MNTTGQVNGRWPRDVRSANECAAFVVVLGLITLIGWTMHVPALVRFQPGWTPMVVNTGIGFVLAGSGLWLAVRVGRHASMLATLVGVLVALLGIEELIVLIFDFSPAFSLPELHRALQPDYVHPGRMAPNTALCFVFFGAGLATISSVKSTWAATWTLAAGVIVATIGLFGVLGYALKLEYMYEWTGVVRMAAHTGIGMVVLGVGLTAVSKYRRRVEATTANEEVRTVFGTAALLLLITASSAGVASFAFLQVQVERQQHDLLQQMSNDRIALIRLEIAGRSARAQVVNNAIQLDPDMPALCAAHAELRTVGSMREWAAKLSLDGFSYVAIDAGGRHLRLSGSPVHADLTVPISGPMPGQLLWSRGFVIRRTLPVCERFHAPGTLITEQRLPVTTASTQATNRFGDTTEMVLCVANGQLLHCFPARSRRQPFTIPPQIAGVPIPMDYAVHGNIGSMIALDYRRHRVLAGFGPIGDTGIGLVVKRDVAEIYAPIREQFQRILIFLLVLLAFGLGVMRRRLAPLVATLERARAQAQAGQARSEAAMESNLDGFFVLECIRDSHGTIEDMRFMMMNAAGERFLSQPRGALMGRGMCTLLPELRTTGLLDACIQVVTTGESVVVERESVMHEMRWYHMQLVKLHDGITMTVRDITSAHQASEIIRHQAHHDPLTGALNRAGFEITLTAALAEARQSDQMLGIALLDLDQFKAINDRMGHAAGDQLLIQTAQRLKASIRPKDMVARLGGDEFVVMLRNISYPEGAEVIAKKLVAQVALPLTLDGQPIEVTISLGLSVYPTHGTEPDQLLRAADHAMYEAKRLGRNRYALFSPQLRISD